MKKILFPTILACLLFASCGKFHYSHDISINSGVWNNFEPRVFEFDWNKPDLCVDLALSVAFDTSRFRDNMLPVGVTMKSPEGELRHFTTNILLRDRDGVLHGEANADGHIVCTEVVRPHIFFNSKGTHRIEVTQNTSKYDLPGIHTVGIRIDKANLDYKR